jgi:hypothetical protein
MLHLPFLQINRLHLRVIHLNLVFHSFDIVLQVHHFLLDGILVAQLRFVDLSLQF